MASPIDGGLGMPPSAAFGLTIPQVRELSRQARIARGEDPDGPAAPLGPAETREWVRRVGRDG